MFMVMKKFLIASLGVIAIYATLNAQGSLTAKEVIEKFIENTGRKERWLNLDSRIERSQIIRYDKSQNFQLDNALQAQASYYQSPDQYLEHTFTTKKNSHSESVLFKSRKCPWYYHSDINSIIFLESEPITFSYNFPRTYLMEPLNLKAVQKVTEEDNMYRVDFIDDRQEGGVQSLYIDKETFLIQRRSFVTKSTMTPWVFTFEDYQTTDGYVEPRLIKLFGGDEPFMTIEVSEIIYGALLNIDLFNPPVKCTGKASTVMLEASFYLPKAIIEND